MNRVLLVCVFILIPLSAIHVDVFYYTNIQYTFLYNRYRNTSFQTYPLLGYPSQKEWISLPVLHSFTNGFFAGIFWNLMEINATDITLQKATDLMLPLAPVANLTDTHDVGFVIMSSFGHAYRLFNIPEYLKIIETAAASLSTRYSPIVRCTRSWNSPEGFLVIIDNMMNLELLFEASNRTNNRTWHEIAWQHANRTMYEHFRPNNSTYHVVEYNETDGNVIRKYTAQGITKCFQKYRHHLLLLFFFLGYANWSTWSRGQAWAVYGFTVAYRYSEHVPFLDKAIGAANYFLSQLEIVTDMIPYWDFDAPHNSTIAYQPRDTSAAAIFASGLIELSGYVATEELKDLYLLSAKMIVNQLTQPNYFIFGHTDYAINALIANGTQGPYPEKPFDVATIFGDYYLTETVLRLSKL